MADGIHPPDFKQKKSFWQRPEGVTGAIFGVGIIAGLGFLAYTILPPLAVIVANTLYLGLLIVAVVALLYMILDPKMRNLIWYMYKSVMRWITGVFVEIDPIGILKSYVDDMKANLRKMSKQIGNLKGQMRKMKDFMTKNEKEIQQNLAIARKAKQMGKEQQMILSTRKAGRLQETNKKYAVLHKKMTVMHRVLTKMYQNSEILLEDTQDQVKLKEQERKVIRASHSAMKSAMSVISGDPDKRAMFDQAIEHITEDVANKVGEMERYMEMSASFMDSIDLQNATFEEKGMQMLEQWEKESTSFLLGDEKNNLLEAPEDDIYLDLNQPTAEPQRRQDSDSNDKYDDLFN